MKVETKRKPLIICSITPPLLFAGLAVATVIGHVPNMIVSWHYTRSVETLAITYLNSEESAYENDEDDDVAMIHMMHQCCPRSTTTVGESVIERNGRSDN
jgi:hypothetical protein